MTIYTDAVRPNAYFRHATRASKHSRSITARFRSLISEPALPANIVSDVIVMAFSALWKIRMIRDKNIRGLGYQIVEHVSALLRQLHTLVEAGVPHDVLQDIPKADGHRAYRLPLL